MYPSEEDNEIIVQSHDGDNDDVPVGHILSRREVLKVLAGAGAALFVGYGATQAGARGLKTGGLSSLHPAGPVARAIDKVVTARTVCVVRPAAEEGPYFIDGQLNRSDTRIDTSTGQTVAGVKLNITFNVSIINGGCAPLEGAMVDIWECDALGNYSGVSPYVGHDFLRGYQLTDANGNASFTLVYPGWYSGRTTHTHFKVRTNAEDPNGGYTFTSQLFYDDNFTNQIYLQSPYNTRPNRNTTNANDHVYQQVGGAQLQLTCVPDGSGGYNANIDFGLVINSGTPIPTATGTALVSATPTLTQPPVATNTPALPTSTAIATATRTNTPVSTNTPVRTNTPIQPTSTAVPTSTGTRTPVATNTPGATGTPVATNTPGATNTSIPTGTAIPTDTVVPTNTPVATPEPCDITFIDVHPGDYFYEAVTYLSCNGVISGYVDDTFRPFNMATRAQLVKIVVLSKGWDLLNPPDPTFSDVPYGSTFYQYVETAIAHGIIGGYNDGTFRPNANVTRGQVCKIVALASDWTLVNPLDPTFSDVPYGSTFYQYIETAVAHGVVGGYQSGIFAPMNDAARGQIAKIVYLALNS